MNEVSSFVTPGISSGATVPGVVLRTVICRPDFADPALALRWRALAAGASAFLSWEWVGCLAAERYADPVLIEALDGDAVVGMAVFARRRGRLGTALYLHESGDPAWDAVFMEQNGVVAAPGRRGAATRAILGAARRLADRVVLSGVDDEVLAAARGVGGIAGPLLTRAAPFRVLGGEAPDGALAGLSRNARGQVRRSDRAYGGTVAIRVARAGTAAEALAWLERLLPWHRATWEGRGVDSPFLRGPVQRFHRALIAGGVETGVVAMLRVSAGEAPIGYLYNLVGGGGMASYQSGFDYAGAPAHGKPGLTSHMAAAGWARGAGLLEYDFLGGDSRYKRSLATGVRGLHWTDVRRRFSVAGAEAVVRRWLGR